jgi:predicted dehydrogenase
MAQPVRIGLVGLGNVASAYVQQAERLAVKGRVELRAACGRPEKRATALGEMRIPLFFENYEGLLASPEVDLVVLLTPPKTHAAMVRAALEAGKHVLVEKPFATTLEDAAGILKLAATSRGLLACAPFTTLSPTFRAMRSRIARGEIGTVASARGRYGWSGPSWSKWFYEPGGGAIFDLGVYAITTLTGLLGPVRRVSAMTGIAVPKRDIDGAGAQQVAAEDNAQILLDFGSSAFAVVTTGFTIQQYRSPAIEVYGSTGTLQMLGDDWDPDGYEFWRNDVGAWQVFKETEPDWLWTDGLRHLVECIETGKKPALSLDHACHVLEIMLKAKEAGRTGQAQPIESTFAPPPVDDAAPSGPAHLVHDRTRKH